VIKQGNLLILMGDGAFLKQIIPPVSNLDQLHQMDWFQEWKGHLVVKGNVQELQQDLTMGYGFSVSERSYCFSSMDSGRAIPDKLGDW